MKSGVRFGFGISADTLLHKLREYYRNRSMVPKVHRTGELNDGVVSPPMGMFRIRVLLVIEPSLLYHEPASSLIVVLIYWVYWRAPNRVRIGSCVWQKWGQKALRGG